MLVFVLVVFFDWIKPIKLSLRPYKNLISSTHPANTKKDFYIKSQEPGEHINPYKRTTAGEHSRKGYIKTQ